MLSTSAQLVVGDMTGGTSILWMRGSSGVWNFFPSTWELCLASPKKQLNELPFPLISLFCRLQMPWLSVPMAPSLGGWGG